MPVHVYAKKLPKFNKLHFIFLQKRTVVSVIKVEKLGTTSQRKLGNYVRGYNFINFAAVLQNRAIPIKKLSTHP